MSKKLQENSKYAMADADGDGVIDLRTKTSWLTRNV